MWTREYLKTRAKKVLKVSYWKAFVVSLILGIAIGDRGGGSGRGFNNLMESLSPEEAFILSLIVIFWCCWALHFEFLSVIISKSAEGVSSCRMLN